MLTKLLLLCGTVSAFLITDTIAAAWAKTEQSKFLFIIFILSPLGYIGFGLINRKMPLGVSSALVNVLIIIGGILLGKIFFGEQLNSMQYFGVALGFIAITLIMMAS